MTQSRPNALPATCSIAFKEWSGVCQALASGLQAIILRKGGIAEENGRFVPEHPVFWLYPTHLHESQQGLRESEATAAPGAADHVPIEALCFVQEVLFVDRPDALAALSELHVWTEETVLKRFHYRSPGIWVLGVRVWRRDEPLLLPVMPEHAGCKSWVPLEQPLPTAGLKPVLSDAEFAVRMERLRAVMDASLTGGPRA
ncbi:MAG TPA: DUF1802 family protein [Isosphaeraceae bacterium]|jgi:hypothetical protein|nr:DUF1802 family protein [Isosphaeraceae bacterium]